MWSGGGCPSVFEGILVGMVDDHGGKNLGRVCKIPLNVICGVRGETDAARTAKLPQRVLYLASKKNIITRESQSTRQLFDQVAASQNRGQYMQSPCSHI
jgi:hypothetical protein